MKKTPLEGLRRLIFSIIALPTICWLLAARHLESGHGAQVLIALICCVFAVDGWDKHTKRRMLKSAPKPRTPEGGDEGA